MRGDGFGPKKAVPEVLTMDSVAADIRHCESVNADLEPCYHCRQKKFLLEGWTKMFVYCEQLEARLRDLSKVPDLRTDAKPGV